MNGEAQLQYVVKNVPCYHMLVLILSFHQTSIELVLTTTLLAKSSCFQKIQSLRVINYRLLISKWEYL